MAASAVHKACSFQISSRPQISPVYLPSLPTQSTSVLSKRRPSLACRAVPEWMRGFLDFSSWAPKSTRIWRLQEYEYPESDPDEVDELEAKINRLQRSKMQAPEASRSATGSPPAPAQPAATGPAGAGSLEDGQLPALGSFSDAGDSDLARALQSRIQTISASTDGDDEEEAEAEETGEETAEVVEQIPELTGQEMRDLILQKYGKTYDCSFARRDIPGKTFVCLNIMWQHLEQRSFRLTEEQYEEKIGSIAYMLNVLGQTKKVRAFLQAPARSQKGLPRRPVVGTAISIQLDLQPDIIEEFFSAGYQ